jgi:hypothetical protein
MNDDVSYAANLGASINRGLGSINAPKKKKPTAKDDKVTDKPAETQQPEATKTQTELPKVKKTSSKKTKQDLSPKFVKSERVNKPAETPKTKEIGVGLKQAPVSSNPNVGKQFKGYEALYGTDRQSPTNLTDLGKTKSGNELDEVTGPINRKGNPTGKYINPTGPIF